MRKLAFLPSCCSNASFSARVNSPARYCGICACSSSKLIDLVSAKLMKCFAQLLQCTIGANLCGADFTVEDGCYLFIPEAVVTAQYQYLSPIFWQPLQCFFQEQSILFTSEKFLGDRFGAANFGNSGGSLLSPRLMTAITVSVVSHSIEPACE